VRAITLLLVPLAVCAQPRPQFVWQGEVDGTAVLHLQGQRATVQIQEGSPVREEKSQFNDPLPDVQQSVRLELLEGRGYVHIAGQPTVDNGYTLTVVIEDRQPGSSFYSLALYWDASNQSFEQGANKIDHLTWSGRVDEQAVVSCQAKSCVSTAASGAPVAAEQYKFTRPMPAREFDVRLQYPEGRGQIHLVEQPRESNRYTAKVDIRDPQSGSGEYSFTLVWNRGSSKRKPLPEPAGRGLLWSGTVAGRVHVTVQGSATFVQSVDGPPVQNARADVLRPLPARSGLTPAVQILRGRGKVAIIESPSQQNNYRLVFEIADPGPGAETYEVEVDW